MFSNTNQSKPTTSLFSNLGSGSTSTTSQPQTGSLFSNLNTSTSQAQTQPSMFSNLNTNTSQTQSQPSLFSNLGGSSQQQTASGSGGLFGASTQPPATNLFASQNIPTSQPLQSSLFASSAPQQQQNQATESQQQQLIGQQSNGQTPQPAYFDSLLERGRKRTNGGETVGGSSELPSLQLGLGDISRRVRELGGTGGQAKHSRGQDAKTHYLLAASGISPGTAIRDLNSFNAQTSTSTTIPRSLDFDPDNGKFVRQLEQQSTLSMIAEGLNRAERDFDAFLEENVTMNWEEQRKRIYEHFGLTPKGGEQDDDSTVFPSPGGKGSFGRSSRRGRAHGATANGHGTSTRSVFGNSGMQKSVIGTPGTGAGTATLFADVADKAGNGVGGQDDRYVRQKQGKYAEKVQQLNAARLREAVYPVLGEFASVEREPGGESPSQLIDAYQALIEIVKENPNANSPTDPDAVKERQYADEYLEESRNSAKTIAIRKRIIDGSRKTLEKHFYQNLESVISRNPREANLGGIPTTINKVRAYIRVRAARKDLAPDGSDLQILEGDYCWVLIFYLLRCGFVKEAAEYVTKKQSSFRAIDRNFITYITGYASSADRRLSRSVQDRINAEYSQRSRIAPEHSIDPYRMACYKIIGRCELNKRNIDSVGQGVEDWIWLQFNLAREVNRVEEVAGEVFALEEVQQTIKEIGQRHFSKGAEGAGGYGIYFFLQILGGMFEEAVAYLYPYSYVAAVHFAIALNFYGLLRVCDFSVSESELLTFTTQQLPQISFGRMIGYYTRDFRTANVEAAVDYLALICLNSDLPGSLGKSQTALCHEALRELVLETREFASLLGDIRVDGTRIKGAIEQRLKLIGLADQEEFLKTVTVQAAVVADDNGRTTDAVLLYHLAEDYDNVTVVINRALSEAIATDIGQEPVKLQPSKSRASAQAGQQGQDRSSLSLTSVDDPAELARNMIGLYNVNAMYYRKIKPANREACGVLLRMNEAKSKVAAEKWDDALDIIDTLNILPLRARSSVPIIRAAAQTFNALPPVVARNVGNLLLWTITCCGKQREALRSSQFEDATRREMSEDLLVMAKDLMVFAGLVRYRMPGRVFEVLARSGLDGVY